MDRRPATSSSAIWVRLSAIIEDSTLQRNHSTLRDTGKDKVTDVNHCIVPYASVTTNSTLNRGSSTGYVGDDERPSEEQLIQQTNNTFTIKTYKIRYYILALFSITAFMQYCAWNAFGPISTTCKSVFGWSNAEIAVMASLDPITYLLTMLYFSWLMDVKGLRKSMLVATFFMALGTGIRCITSDKNYVTWTMAAGQFFNGLAGPVTQAAPPLLSANWFPPEQRTTATALASLLGTFGVALSFIIGPYAVKEIDFPNYHFDIPHLAKIKEFERNIYQHNFSTSPTYFRDSIYKNASHYWSFDGSLNGDVIDKEDKLIHDHIGGKTGLIFGDVYRSTGIVNRSVTLPSSKGFISLGNYPYDCLEDVALCHKGLTIAYWLKLSNTTSTFQHIMGTGHRDNRKVGFLVYHQHSINTSKPIITVRFNNGYSIINTSVAIEYGEWYHFVITWNVTYGITIYLNGILNNIGRQKYKVKPSYVDSSTFIIGNRNENQKKVPWNVSIDELVVWRMILHPAEIRVIYLRNMGLEVEPGKVEKKEDLAHTISQRTSDVMRLMYIEFIIILVLFILVVVYFPDKPPTPPSQSARLERSNFKDGTKALLRSGPFWTLGLVYGITTGVFSGWGAVLNVNLSGFGISQDESGWIGFYAVLAGVFAGLLLARCADYFGGHMKVLILVLFCGATGCFLWFALLCLNIVTYSSGDLYKASILGSFFVTGSIPLFYELTIETTYPIAEGITTGLLTLINNLFTVIFLIILMIPNVGTIWMNWCLFGSCAIGIPVLLLFRESYGRLNIDLDRYDEDDAQPSPSHSTADEEIERQEKNPEKDDISKGDCKNFKSKTLEEKIASPWKRLSSTYNNKAIPPTNANEFSSPLLCLEDIGDVGVRLSTARESDI